MTHEWAPRPPAAVAALLAGLAEPWWLAGGYAADAWAGRPTRPHADVDVAVPRYAADAVRRHLAGWDLHAAESGTLRPWPVGEPAPRASVWCRPAPGAPWKVELLFEETDGAEWVYRRDPRVRRPLASLGERVLVPEVLLLYKSAAPRPADEADLAVLAPLLDDAAREWLAAALRLTAPGHPWLGRL